ncbi:hypothetical protein VARIO8X_120297 [Burkholderiales bacterium 8X]|nr:hypothetical protein VARIO8X_120297 [Burkholderiales bacterium 8X]
MLCAAAPLAWRFEIKKQSTISRCINEYRKDMINFADFKPRGKSHFASPMIEQSNTFNFHDHPQDCF